MEIVKKTNNWANLPPLSEIDLAERAKDWQDELEPEIPREYLFVSLSRARKNHTSTFAINLYEIAAAYREIETEERALKAEAENEARKENPVLFCSNKENHINDAGEVKLCNPLNFNEEIVLPCFSCRPRAYDDQRARFIAKNKVEEIKPLEIVQKIAEIEKPKKVEPEISPEEIKALSDEYHGLLSELVEDQTARQRMFLVWDEGGRCFKYPHSARVTHSPDAMRKIIADYKRILDEKGNQNER